MHTSDDSPTIIGIAGGSASGKTELAKALARDVGQCGIISQDAYYRDPFPAGLSFDQPTAIDWILLEQHIETMLRGNPVKQPLYDFATHSRSGESRMLDPRPILILEGLHILGRLELMVHLDLGIFVDTPADVRLMRRLRRDTRERGRTVDSVLDQYESEVRPMHVEHVEPTRHHADLVLDGMVRPGDNVGAVLEFARSRGLKI